MVVALSGIPAVNGEFAFLGFFPRSSMQRAKLLERLPKLGMVTIFFEAPHRLEFALDYLLCYLPASVQIVVCREMTKVHQTVYRGTPRQILEKITSFKGEFVIVIPPITANLSANLSIANRIQIEMSRDPQTTMRQAVKAISQQMSIPGRRIIKLFEEEQRQKAAEKQKEKEKQTATPAPAAAATTKSDTSSAPAAAAPKSN